MILTNIRLRPKKHFGYTDTEDLYKRNLSELSEDWCWRNKQITYNINSQGYRAPEWNNVDWNNSVLFFGCSFVYGVGINFEDTCTYQLSNLINMPVVNMGIPGGSPLLQWVNTTIFRSENIKPKAVVYYWPYSQRTAELMFNNDAVCHVSAPIKGGFNEKWVLHKENRIVFLKYLIMNTNFLWDCPVLHYHMEKNVCSLIEDLKYMPHSDVKTYLDKARDYDIRKGAWHAGPETNKFWAKTVYDDLMAGFQ